MRAAFICDAVRTPIGRYGGALSGVRTDDLASLPIRELVRRNPDAEWSALDDVMLGCANQAGEDNRNVARMAVLLAGLHESVPGVTVNRLCGSGMEAVAAAARVIANGEADFLIAGGVESMSRAPFAMSKPEAAFQRSAEIYDTTIGWRFVNPRMRCNMESTPCPKPERTLRASAPLIVRRRMRLPFAARCARRELLPIASLPKKLCRSRSSRRKKSPSLLRMSSRAPTRRWRNSRS